LNYPDYVAPTTLDETLERLHDAGGSARIAAGGTDLVPRMRRGDSAPALLVDVRRLPLDGIEQRGDNVVIGARVIHTQLGQSDLLARHFPALVDACQSIGGPPIRNRGTLGGNLANASPAADTAPPLLAYDATITLVSQRGQRALPLADFFTGPGATVLAPDELITAVQIPFPLPWTAAVFLKLGKRRAMAIAVASVAARLSCDSAGRVTTARIALGSVAPTPMRATKAEATLHGSQLDEDVIASAARHARDASSPISDIRASADYRRRMVEVLTRRALTAAWQQLGEA